MSMRIDEKLIWNSYVLLKEAAAGALELVQSKMLQELIPTMRDDLQFWEDAGFGSSEAEIKYNLTNDDGNFILLNWLDLIADANELYSQHSSFLYKKDLTSNGVIVNVTNTIKERVSSKISNDEDIREDSDVWAIELLVSFHGKAAGLGSLDNLEYMGKSLMSGEQHSQDFDKMANIIRQLGGEETDRGTGGDFSNITWEVTGLEKAKNAIAVFIKNRPFKQKHFNLNKPYGRDTGGHWELVDESKNTISIGFYIVSEPPPEA